ncbi:MAG: MFS transporter [Neisseriaceae bacterium]|nr:MFS transporter [Neisseriaceae bacterium]MBP6862266.1 MFS transporter [Neisseriaceae bacterium]
MRQSDLNVDALLDQSGVSRVQMNAFLLAALAIVMDGFDGQLIGYAIPTLLQEWQMSREELAPTLAIGLVGVGIGSALAGMLADRFGRRPALVLSVLLFGLATVGIGFATNLTNLTVLRFVAGLGIGGALPTATTLTAEFTPSRRRTMAITATIVCIPIGGMLSGLFSGLVLPQYGWRWLFYIGGGLSTALALLLWWVLPESPRYLARFPKRVDQLRHMLRKMGHHIPAGATFVDPSVQDSAQKAGVAGLFEGGLRRETVTLWLAFFMCLMTVYMSFSWLPTMLSHEGLSIGMASSGLAAFNLGGILGSIGCALMVTRFGSRVPMLIFCGGAAMSALLLLGVDVVGSTGLLIFGLGVNGMFTNAVQAILYPLCAYVYPTKVRATGTAMALVAGRLGTVVSAFAGAAVITFAGLTGYMMMLAIGMLLVLLALLFTRKHIPANFGR